MEESKRNDENRNSKIRSIDTHEVDPPLSVEQYDLMCGGLRCRRTYLPSLLLRDLYALKRVNPVVMEVMCMEERDLV